ncbi:uncharacterized protein CLBA1 isoform X2 [Bombina bombina]|uniref:uncharacterized protein CLBA1 isoform X2 n=1 Tax=Bombina bombina TaxID=8345 RepID=UPI00235A7E32|nr:uncharacterized protein CLBA1 isoform X2 [Bombina bombina]
MKDEDCLSGGNYMTLWGMEEFPLADNDKVSTELYEDWNPKQALPELSSTWGDFESFNGFTPDYEEFPYPDEELSDTIKYSSFHTQNVLKSYKEAENCRQNDPYSKLKMTCPAAVGADVCEHVLRTCFPAVPVEPSSDDVRSLHNCLKLTNEENFVNELMKMNFWPDCASTETRDAPPPRYHWKDSLSCRNLMLLFGIDASHKCPEESDVISDGTEQNSASVPWRSDANPTLIQTKISPNSKQGHIFSYELFLKKTTPAVTLPFLAFAGKKSFFSAQTI